jgi:hypothetical protein
MLLIQPTALMRLKTPPWGKYESQKATVTHSYSLVFLTSPSSAGTEVYFSRNERKQDRIINGGNSGGK